MVAWLRAELKNSEHRMARCIHSTGPPYNKNNNSAYFCYMIYVLTNKIDRRKYKYFSLRCYIKIYDFPSGEKRFHFRDIIKMKSILLLLLLLLLIVLFVVVY